MMDTRNTSSDSKRKLQLSEAAAYLGVSPSLISRRVKAGEIAVVVDPLDKRRKLVDVDQLDRLKNVSLGKE
jgi:predicted site-specific integrase-resolvase